MNQEQKFVSVMKRIAGAMLIFVAAINLLYGGVLQVGGLFDSFAAYLITDILGSVAYAASFILPVLFFYRVSRHAQPERMDLTLHFPEKHTGLQVLSVLFMGIPLVLTMAYWNSVLQPFGNVGGDYGTGTMQPYEAVLMFLSTAIAPAFAEELMFRGMIYKNLRPFGRSMAIVVSALLFGLMHQNASQLLYATAAGVVLALAYEITGSFWCCVLLHFFNNFFAVIQQVWLTKYPIEQATLLCTIAEMILFAIGLILVLVWIKVVRRDAAREGSEARTFFGGFEQTRPTTVAISGSVLRKGFFNPIMIVFLVITALQMLLLLFI